MFFSTVFFIRYRSLFDWTEAFRATPSGHQVVDRTRYADLGRVLSKLQSAWKRCWSNSTVKRRVRFEDELQERGADNEGVRVVKGKAAGNMLVLDLVLPDGSAVDVVVGDC